MSEIAPKSRWVQRGSPRIIRVMGVVEGWVVARFTGCAPFLLHANDWPKKYQPAPPAKPQEPAP